MNTTANARFAIQSWDEKPYSEGPDLPRLTRATVTKTFTGPARSCSSAEEHSQRARRGRTMP